MQILAVSVFQRWMVGMGLRGSPGIERSDLSCT